METVLPLWRFIDKQVKRKRKLTLLLGFLCLNLVSLHIFSQSATGSISGNVIDTTGTPLVGATVIADPTKAVASVELNGDFTIKNVPDGQYVLSITMVGYAKKQISVSVVNGMSERVKITMSEDNKLDEVIVTGTFDKRTALNSSIAITTLDSKILDRQQAISASDLLKNVPGVFVNSALGETRNTVYSRGVAAGSNEANSGYYYVSMQEDGLPITNITFDNFGPDYFNRPDVTLQRLEAVRGGPASVTSANAPGGIFNYISKTGGDKKFSGEARAKGGVLGNGNPYYRGDLDFGGTLANGWNYNIGGFYRYDMGARAVSYPLNNGGQVKANITKTFKGGYVKVYGKYLNDKNGWYEFQPAVNYNNPTLAPGVSQYDNFLMPKLSTTIPYGGADKSKTFDPTTLTHSKETAIGLDVSYDLNSTWTIRNNGKYSYKDVDWQSSAWVFSNTMDKFNIYNLLGTDQNLGTYTFSDPLTGQGAVVDHSTPSTYNVLSNTLPQNIQKNGVITDVGYVQPTTAKEVMDQLSITKKFDKMSFTGGGYFGYTDVSTLQMFSGAGIGPLKNNPNLMDITLTKSNGAVYQLTDKAGLAYTGGGGFINQNKGKQTTLAAFLGHNWQMFPKLNLDWGVRYENINVKKTGNFGVLNPNYVANPGGYGGVDGDSLTLYDNQYFVPGTDLKGNTTMNLVSVSAGLNYKLSNRYSLYVRYSRGQKAPDMAYFFSLSNQDLVNQVPKPQIITQVEAGYKGRLEKLSFAVIGFYSKLSNITSKAQFSNGSSYYFTAPIFNSTETEGIELEGNYTIVKNFSVRAVGTFQYSKTVRWQVWNPGATNSPADDFTTDYSGNKTDNVPNVMFNIAPTYATNKFYASLNYKFMGDRPANVAGAFTLPSFSQFDLALGYNFNKSWMLSANVNNLLNGKGVMSWSPPGGYPSAGNRQSFYASDVSSNPNATFAVITIQPRSTYLTLTYKF